MNDAQTAVTQLTNVVTNAVKRSIDAIEKTEANLEEFSKSATTTATVLLENSVSTSLTQIANIDEDATLHGLDASSCIKDNEEHIKNLPVNIGNTMSNYVNGNLTNSKAVVKKATTQINSLLTTVTKLQNKLSGCAIGIPGLQCYIDVITEAVKQTSNLPQKATSLEITAINDIDDIKTKIVESTIVLANDAETGVTILTQKITECVENLGQAN